MITCGNAHPKIGQLFQPPTGEHGQIPSHTERAARGMSIEPKSEGWNACSKHPYTLEVVALRGSGATFGWNGWKMKTRYGSLALERDCRSECVLACCRQLLDIDRS